LSIYGIEVLARLNETIVAIEDAYHEYQFNVVAQHLYRFVWTDYCDRFVEAAKTEIFGPNEAKKHAALAVMDYVLSAVLRLLHPFMPHILKSFGLCSDSAKAQFNSRRCRTKCGSGIVILHPRDELCRLFTIL